MSSDYYKTIDSDELGALLEERERELEKLRGSLVYLLRNWLSWRLQYARWRIAALWKWLSPIRRHGMRKLRREMDEAKRKLRREMDEAKAVR